MNVKRKPFVKVTTLDEFDYKIILTLAKDNMKPTETARELYVHRNSVIYHIEKIRRLTGLDPLNFYDLHKLVEMAMEKEYGK